MQNALWQAVQKKQVSHAYLFCGPAELCQKEAYAMAVALNCSDWQADGPCGKCRSCKQMANGNHPDFTVLGTLDGKQKISIEQIRQLKQKAALRSYQAGYQIFFFPMVENFTLQAANSLLQILEEPPSGTVFLLTAAHEDLLLPTIVSRCQVLHLAEGEEGRLEDSREIFLAARDFLQSIPHTNEALLLQGSKNWDGKNSECLRFLTAMLYLIRDSYLPQGSPKELFLAEIAIPPLFGENAAFAVAEVEKSIQYLQKQVNLKMTLDVLALHLKQWCLPNA